MKIIKQKFTLVSEDPTKLGEVTEQKPDTKVANFISAPATLQYKKMLITEGYGDNLGLADVAKEKKSITRTITIDGDPIQCHFVYWKNGTADFFVGQSNIRGFYKESNLHHSFIFNFKDKKGEEKSRIFNKHIKWYGVMLSTKSLKNNPDIEYLLFPLEDLPKLMESSGKDYIAISSKIRKEYSFLNQIRRKYGSLEDSRV